MRATDRWGKRTEAIADLLRAGWRLWQEDHRSYPTGWNLYPPLGAAGVRTVRPLDVLRLQERDLLRKCEYTNLTQTFTWWEWGGDQ